MTDLGQSNVEYICTALEGDPELHAIEVTRERYEAEGLGERPAADLAFADFDPAGSFLPSVMAWFHQTDVGFRLQIDPARTG